jgi:hypothetical protein
MNPPQLAERTINLPSVKPVRVIVAGTVRFFIIEFVCEIVEILGRWATADSSVVLAIRHKCGWPATVLRRRRALSRDTYRVGLSRVERHCGFEAQIVNPAVTEVILIHESLEAAQI